MDAQVSDVGALPGVPHFNATGDESVNSTCAEQCMLSRSCTSIFLYVVLSPYMDANLIYLIDMSVMRHVARLLAHPRSVMSRFRCYCGGLTESVFAYSFVICTIISSNVEGYTVALQYQ